MEVGGSNPSLRTKIWGIGREADALPLQGRLVGSIPICSTKQVYGYTQIH